MLSHFSLKEMVSFVLTDSLEAGNSIDLENDLHIVSSVIDENTFLPLSCWLLFLPKANDPELISRLDK